MKSNIRACSKSCRLFFVRYLMVDLLPIPSMLPINYLYWIFKPLLKLSWRTAYSIKITGKEKIEKVEISDIAGRVVYNAQQVDLINTSLFSSGIYFVKVRNEGVYYNSSFILQK